MQLATNGHALGHSSTLCIKQWNVWMIACCCCGTLQDLKEAKAHYNKLVERLISNGTTTALVFGSLHLSPQSCWQTSCIRWCQICRSLTTAESVSA